MTTESDVCYETTQSGTCYERKWRWIPAMKSSLKAAHIIKGNSKEVSQAGERLPGHAQRRKPEWHTKNASIYALSGHERIEKRSEE